MLAEKQTFKPASSPYGFTEEDSPTHFLEWKIGTYFDNWRLDLYLCYKLPQFSRTQVQKIIQTKIELSWSKNVRSSSRLKEGGVVKAYLPRLNEKILEWETPILHEDDDLLVINKPSGLLVHATGHSVRNTLIDVLRRSREGKTYHLIHRLDRETSGIIVLAKSPETASSLGKLMMKRGFQKTYLARLHGTLNSDVLEIKNKIGKHPTSQIYIRRAIMPEGEEAITQLTVLSRLPDSTVVQLTPKTGRRHQLRVHCEAIGHAICGDPIYGHDDEVYLDLFKSEKKRTERLELHAQKLSFKWKETNWSFEAPIPDDLKSSWGGIS